MSREERREEKQLDRRFCRRFCWQYPLYLALLFWVPLLAALLVVADDLLYAIPALGMRLALVSALEAYWMVFLGPVILPFLFWPLLQGARRADVRMRALYHPLELYWKRRFLEDAVQLRRNHGFFCGETGVWMALLPFGRGRYFGAMTIPWQYFAGTRRDPKHPTWLFLRDTGGEEYLLRTGVAGDSVEDCLRALARHRAANPLG